MITDALAPPSDPLADLAGGIDRLQAEDLQRSAASELGPRLKALRCAVNRLEAEAARTLEAFDRTRAYAPAGALSAASWLRHHCNLSGGAASDQVQLARRLPELPRARRAFAAGEVSITHVSLLARTAGQVGLEPVQEQEEVLVEAARSLDPRMFGQVCDHLRHCVDAGGALADANRAQELRAVWLSQTMDGVWDLRGTLDAEGGAILQAALAAVEGKPQPDDQRTAPQRRHDALVELGRRRLDAGDLPSSGGQRPHLVVSADLDTLAGKPAGAGVLNWNQLVPAETARRLACDCSVTPMVTGPGGEPLSVGRARRTIPAPMRRAIAERDRHCRFGGCDRPVGWADGHHLWHWVDGGPTAASNIYLVCGRHHRMLHEGGWRLERKPDGALTAIPP